MRETARIHTSSPAGRELRRIGYALGFLCTLVAAHALLHQVVARIGANHVPHGLTPEGFPRLVLEYPLDAPTATCLRLVVVGATFELPALIALGLLTGYGQRYSSQPEIFGAVVVLATSGWVIAPLPEFAHAARLPVLIWCIGTGHFATRFLVFACAHRAALGYQRMQR